MADPSVYALCTVGWGLEVIEQIGDRIPIKGIAGLSERDRDDAISGYRYIEPFCQARGYEYVPVQSYTMGEAGDRDRLLALDLDVLLVLGWQRLIPPWLIEHAKIGAIGVHGSVHGITGGRGRSPQNWALLLGADRFEVSIFFIDPGVDSGDVIATRDFALTPHDDIRTSYHKVGWATVDMLVDAWRNGAIAGRRATPQQEGAKYLPQRRPEDGEIDWTRTTRQIYDFVRALTDPYPGAFSMLDGAKLVVWRARPFMTTDSPDGHEPGELVSIFADGSFLVRTGDGLLLIEDSVVVPDHGNPSLRKGAILPSASFSEQIRTIATRHRQRYPELEIADDVLRAGGLD